MTSALTRAREAFAARAWTQAIAAFASADGLEPADHERMAVAAYMTGADEQCERAWESAHHLALDGGDPAEAARCATWLGLCLMLRGQMARAGGWLARARELVAEAGGDGPASGYVLIPAILAKLDGGDAAAARELASRAIDAAKRFDDADLRALAVLGLGQALIAEGDIAGGRARLDDVMVSVTSGEVGPIAAGIVYCAVILECMALFDLPRAAEWTTALTDWCDAQPDVVAYRGQCLVHRSQLQMATGQWSEAIATADAACRRLTDPPHPALGLAWYQEGELHRLRGAFEAAAEAYRQASRNGFDPVPGLALLEFARGDVDAAATTLRRALHEARTPTILAAAADVLPAAGDTAGARVAADELTALATAAPSPALDAMAAHARGGVCVAEGDAAAGLADLRAAARAWHSLRMPYDAARTAVVLAEACTALGDRAAASLELDNARAIFSELGARPDLERMEHLRGRPTPARSSLSVREREVLVQLATGKTNREIGAALHISQHTVGRHVENVFTKLGVTSRAAATARAYELGLIAT